MLSNIFSFFLVMKAPDSQYIPGPYGSGRPLSVNQCETVGCVFEWQLRIDNKWNVEQEMLVYNHQWNSYGVPLCFLKCTALGSYSTLGVIYEKYITQKALSSGSSGSLLRLNINGIPELWRIDYSVMVLPISGFPPLTGYQCLQTIGGLTLNSIHVINYIWVIILSDFFEIWFPCEGKSQSYNDFEFIDNQIIIEPTISCFGLVFRWFFS